MMYIVFELGYLLGDFAAWICGWNLGSFKKFIYQNKEYRKNEAVKKAL